MLRVGISRFVYKKNSFDSVCNCVFSCAYITKMEDREEHFRHILPFCYRKECCSGESILCFYERKGCVAFRSKQTRTINNHSRNRYMDRIFVEKLFSTGNERSDPAVTIISRVARDLARADL